jgi:hypothetical protein
MKNKSLFMRTLIITIICVSYLLLTIFYYHINKYLTGFIYIILTLLIATTFIAILVYSIKGLMQVFRNFRYLTSKIYIPIIIAWITLTYTLFSPYKFDSENLESDISFRACYEGTQNQSTIKFRTDNSFEIHSTGAFFANKWYLGHWRLTGDTLFLKFNKEGNRLLSDTIILKDNHLIPISQEFNDSLIKYNRFYYLGYCKGLN